MTLLWVVSSHDGFELAEGGSSDIALEAPADLSIAETFGASSSNVALGGFVATHPASHDDVQRPVELPIA